MFQATEMGREGKTFTGGHGACELTSLTTSNENVTKSKEQHSTRPAATVETGNGKKTFGAQYCLPWGAEVEGTLAHSPFWIS
jgi:hypothetical protein